MLERPLVLVHGYSDQGSSFENWKNALVKELKCSPAEIHICSYKTLTNEVTIADIAEGFDRILRSRPGLKNERGEDRDFDAIVHSTGMLVIRAWLTKYGNTTRRGRLKHLIGIAPATFGSPLAHTGRSWLGSIFKGGKSFGPDFLEAGDQVLDGLELGSRFTWELAHRDLLGDQAFYGPDAKTPFVFIFCGTTAYKGYRQLVNQPGTDGTVRWAGCQLNTRKIVMDLTRKPSEKADSSRFDVPAWKNTDMPFVLVEGYNHGTILTDPEPDLVELVGKALGVTDATSLERWKAASAPVSDAGARNVTPWQQFIVHAVDERGDPITDFHVEVFEIDDKGDPCPLDAFELDVHQYSSDSSFRCFHVNLNDLFGSRKQKKLFLRAIASSGSNLVGYHGFGSYPDDRDLLEIQPNGRWDAEIDITPMLADDARARFFFPFTTTLVELQFNREPLPIKDGATIPLCAWI